MKKTSITLSTNTKDLLDLKGGKNDSYETIIQRLLKDSLTENEIINGWLVNQPEDIKACFYMGVLLAKVFDNPARSKHWESIKQLKKDNYQKVYRIIISNSEVDEYESLKEKTSAELLAAGDLLLNDDDMNYYYHLGITLASKF